MNTLHLTVDEIKLFDALSDDLKEGWEVEEEKGEFEDTEDRFWTRASFLRLSDPKMQEYVESARKTQDAEELVKLVEETDLTDVNQADMAELFFALGPKYITPLVAQTLANAKTDKDVELATSLTMIRHELLASLSSQFS